MEKIKRKNLLIIGCWLLVLGLLVYTRFVNLGWGLPYPMHPDERNMAMTIEQLNCNLPIRFSIFNFQFSILKECFNPRFFAYGQFPLYLGYGMIKVYKGLLGRLEESITFPEAVISLRLISVLASIVNSLVLIKIVKLVLGERYSIFDIRYWENKNKDQLISNIQYLLSFLIIIFSPFFIQFSHFGTTESLLMLFYSLTVFLSLKLIDIPKKYNDRKDFLELVFLLALIGGLAMATKISSLIFVVLPLVAFFYKGYTVLDRSYQKRYKEFIFILGLYFGLLLFFSIVFSPHNLLSFNEFISSVKYESEVALGKYVVFYTRQFVGTNPVLFQLEKIFPYALGWPIYILGILGFLRLGWRDKKINLLRLAFLIYFLPNAFLFTKWTRFMAPIFPIMTIFASLFILNLKDKISKLAIKNQKFLHFALSFLFFIFYFLILYPGIAYLSIYQNPDVRFVASQWIYKNIPENAYILSETANVVDLPIPVESDKVKKVYKLISFNFYDLDENLQLQKELKDHLQKADYIIVPSRRIFANHSCQRNFQFSIFNFPLVNKCSILKHKYPLLNQYYSDLFSGKLGFKKIAEFDSYPKLNFQFSIFNFQLKFPDEQAEETWSVFDHPVIRIYKKIESNMF